MSMSTHSLRFPTISLLLMIGGILFFHRAFAQGAGLQAIETRFENFREKNLQEKLYVQSNKDFYVAGEVLWFKIFDLNGSSNAPFLFSKVAYVELLDQQKTPVLQTKVSLKGDGSGSVLIPYTIHTGNYILRAYTSWMKNFAPEFYYHRSITIVNTTVGHDFPERDKHAEYRIRFFPEGGNLVAGLKSEVAFKMSGRQGTVRDFKGVVVDENGDTAARFHPFKFGMGHFSFLPEKEHSYHAVIRTRDGHRIVKDLPDPYEQGYVLHVAYSSGSKIKITLQKNIPSARQAYLIIHTREAVKAAEVLSFTGDKAVFELDQKQLAEGISQITIFDSEKQPVCERLYFKPVKSKLSLDIKTDKQQYATREKVQLNLTAHNEKGKGIPAAWTLSVFKLDALQQKSPENILNYLWLSSELQGPVDHPDYYFREEQDSIRQAADNLMMTQGWRRFDWTRLLKGIPVNHPYIPEIKGPVISGVITNPEKHEPASDTKAYLALPGKQVHLYVSQSNREGAVFFNMKDFYGPHQVVVRTNTATGDSLDQIKILSPFSEKYSHYALPAFPVTASQSSLLKAHNLWLQVGRTYHHKDRELWRPEPIDTLPFYGKPYNSYLLDNYTRYVTMEEVLREYVGEVAVRKRNRHYHFMVMNALLGTDQPVSDMLFQDDPLVLFDGIPVFNLDKVMAFDPLKVQKIDVVAGRYIYGPLVADGVVSFTTYKGDLRDYPLNPGAVVVDYEGLQRQRIFYSPEYETNEDQSSRIPDFRNALFWSPDIRTDSAGKAACSFYTSDLPGKYLIIANGISAEGRAGYQTAIFEVKQP